MSTEPSSEAADAPETPDAPTPAAPARRRRLPLVLIGIGSLLAIVAIFSLWANRQLLNSDNWTDTSTELLEDDDIRSQVSIFLVDQLYANVDVQGQLQLALPPRAQPLAGPAAGALRDLAVRGVNALLERPRVQGLWEEANRRAHERLLQVVEGGGDVVSTEEGDVTLDLKEMLGATEERFGVGGRAQERLPDDAAQITVLEADNLELAQDAVDLLKAAAIVIVGLALGLLALAIGLASGWRREALRAAGFGLIFAGVAVLALRTLAGDAVVGALAETEAVKPAVESTWEIATSLLVQAATASILYGIVMVGSAWLAGPTRAATSLRHGLAPFIREPGIAYGGLAVLVLVILAWGPTPALRNPATAIVLVALLAYGLEILRRHTAREFPNASREESMARLRARISGIRSRPAATGEGGNGAATDRIEQLERLGRLRESGVLDEQEFEREKAELIGSGVG